jgi:hypothetical protein
MMNLPSFPLVQRTMKAGELHKAEWDFSGVPEPEWEACFYLEFALISDLIKNGPVSWCVAVPNSAEIKLA